MKFRPARLLSVLVLTLAFTLAVLGGCSSKSDGTAPGPGVPGPAFSFSFPATGTSHTQQFTDIGSWGYHCIAHASLGMTGTVIVVASGGVDSAVVQVGAGGFNFSPATVTINAFDAAKPAANGNGYVRWVNVSGLATHTVTRP